MSFTDFGNEPGMGDLFGGGGMDSSGGKGSPLSFDPTSMFGNYGNPFSAASQAANTPPTPPPDPSAAASGTGPGSSGQPSAPQTPGALRNIANMMMQAGHGRNDIRRTPPAPVQGPHWFYPQNPGMGGPGSASTFGGETALGVSGTPPASGPRTTMTGDVGRPPSGPHATAMTPMESGGSGADWPGDLGTGNVGGNAGYPSDMPTPAMQQGLTPGAATATSNYIPGNADTGLQAGGMPIGPAQSPIGPPVPPASTAGYAPGDTTAPAMPEAGGTPVSPGPAGGDQATNAPGGSNLPGGHIPSSAATEQPQLPPKDQSQFPQESDPSQDPSLHWDPAQGGSQGGSNPMQMLQDFLFGGPRAMLQDLLGLSRQMPAGYNYGMGDRAGREGEPQVPNWLQQRGGRAPQGTNPWNYPQATPEQVQQYRRTGTVPASSPSATEKPQSFSDSGGKGPKSVSTTKEAGPGTTQPNLPTGRGDLDPFTAGKAGGTGIQPAAGVPGQVAAAGGPGSSGLPAKTGNVRRDVASTLRASGMSDNAIAGIFANIHDESSWNPNLRHPDQPRFGGEAHYAHGLYQEGGENWNRYERWLHGRNWQDPQLQSQFLAENLRTRYPRTWARMNAARTPGEAASIFVNEYLRPAAQYRFPRSQRYMRGTPALTAYGIQ